MERDQKVSKSHRCEKRRGNSFGHLNRQVASFLAMMTEGVDRFLRCVDKPGGRFLGWFSQPESVFDEPDMAFDLLCSAGYAG
jgi:hypothetical protein